MLNLELFDDKKVLDGATESHRPLFLRLSAAFRTLPDVFIVGAQKAGTTSLYAYLMKHPQIIPSKFKEHYFFHNSHHFEKGLNFYKSGFASRLYAKWREIKTGSAVHCMDATANYFEFPESAKRIAGRIPNAKVIVLLRNPVDRAWSHYKMARRLGFEKADFATALDQEDERISWGAERGKHNYVFQRLAYRNKGVYIDFLPEWKDVFGNERLLVLQSEKLFENPDQKMKEVFAFLGLSELSGVSFPHINPDPDGLKMTDDVWSSLNEFYKPLNKNLFDYVKEKYDWSND